MYETLKILIVDDKEANLFSMEQILKETGAEIIRANNGNEALIASLNHDFALALLDVQMPVMDGYELAELLRSEEKTAELPIIFVSAVYSSDHHVFKGYDAGAVDFMTKPFNSKVLIGKVRIFLELHRQKQLLGQAKIELEAANINLELRVEERTAELVKAKKEWQEIFEAIGQMTFILDKNHNIIAANKAAVEQTGISSDKLLGTSCCSIFHGEGVTVKSCPLGKILESAQFQYSEMEVEALGRTYLLSCTPYFDEQRELEKLILVATDITKRERLKKELIQAHKMEAIGTLAGGIAHDFNNILSAVLGFTGLCMNSVEKGSEMEDDLRQVYSAGIRAKDLVQQILNFARKSDEEVHPVRLDLIIKEVIKFLSSTIPATVNIHSNINSKKLVLANPVKIHQLMMNLCTNASHAMDENGKLSISLADVNLQQDDLPGLKHMMPGGYICLKVADNGCGIPEKNLESIFQPYFTTKKIEEGTGMGLALVHNIVKECGGHISVESAVGKGSVFNILLPATEHLEKDNNRTPQNELPAGSENILFVDDEVAITKLAKRILEGHGYKVTTTSDPEMALQSLAKHPEHFDLVITDMTMPKMSGMELIKKIHALHLDIPIIVATGFSKKIINHEATELGAQALVNKPFSKVNLTNTVRKVLDEI